ncbi:MAG: hypothetical protein QOE41_106 [Mycobacterium sp.]|jgi:hypothetical protein|nr:hypothetical protein [Mycobacterium sp.]MDT5130795.1 hypothetical protein [Mycobacterium sp.]
MLRKFAELKVALSGDKLPSEVFNEHVLTCFIDERTQIQRHDGTISRSAATVSRRAAGTGDWPASHAGRNVTGRFAGERNGIPTIFVSSSGARRRSDTRSKRLLSIARVSTLARCMPRQL